MHRLDQGSILLAATRIGPGFDADSRRMLKVRCILVANSHVGDRRAIRSHIAVEAPVLAQNRLQQRGVRARRLTINRVIRAHHAACLRLHNGRAKCRQIRVFEIVWRRIDIGRMPCTLRSRVHRIMLRRCNRLVIVRIIPLQSLDKVDSEAAGKERIFAIRLLTATPARVTEDIDVGRPDIKSEINTMDALAQCFTIFRASLRADRRRHITHQRHVPHCCEANRLWEHRRIAGARNAVQSLAPPIVRRHSQSRDRRGMILHLRYLFLQRHLAHQFRHAPRRLGCRNVRRDLRHQGRREQESRTQAKRPSGIKESPNDNCWSLGTHHHAASPWSGFRRSPIYSGEAN